MAHSVEVIWQQFHHKLKSFISSKIHDDALTDDILQEVFLRIHSNIHTLKDETRLKSWIYQITRNLITDHYRKAVQNKSVPFDGAAVRDAGTFYPVDFQIHDASTHQDEWPGFFLSPEAEAGSGDVMTEAVQDMIKMMKELPPEYCQALCLTELEGLSQKEYAARAGISLSGAKSRVQRARRLLRDMLMRCCHYQFDRYGTVIGIFPAGCCCCSTHSR